MLSMVLIGLAVALGMLVIFWGLLWVLARRFPGGLLEQLYELLPNCRTTLRRLRSEPIVPLRAKLVLGFAVLWVLSPVDLIPEFIPIIGPLDDIIVVALALRYAARQVPREVVVAAWPGDPKLIERLLGSPSPRTRSTTTNR